MRLIRTAETTQRLDNADIMSSVFLSLPNDVEIVAPPGGDNQDMIGVGPNVNRGPSLGTKSWSSGGSGSRLPDPQQAF